METSAEDLAMQQTHRTVWFVGAVFAALGGALGGLFWSWSIAAGATLAALNLMLLSRTVRNLVEGRRASWGAIAAVKFVGLLGIIFALIQTGLVDTLGLGIGFGAMPCGILLAGLFFPPAPSPLNANQSRSVAESDHA